MRLIISGGGTGGHIYPAVAIAKEVLKLDKKCEILFVGTKEGLEADIIPKEGFNFETINVRGFSRSLKTQNIKAIFNAGNAVYRSLSIIRKFKPDVAVGTGGFVCGPVLLAANILGIATLIQEQNVIPGVTNKILARFSKKIAVGYQEAAEYFKGRRGKVVVTGNPVRPEVLAATREEGQKALGLDKDKTIILVSGGSRGARSINTAMVKAYKYLMRKPQIQILHITGQTEYNNVVDNIKQEGIELPLVGNIIIKPYLYNMPDALAAADIAIFRAGALGLAELNCKGVPAILIPYPYAAENHQEYNAMFQEKNGAAIMIKDTVLNAEILVAKIDELINNKDKLKKMSVNSQKLHFKDAGKNIAMLVTSLI